MIRPTGWKDPKTLEVWHDEANHGGEVDLKDLVFPKDVRGGGDMLSYLTLACPVCAATSWHPVTGDGSSRAEVQKMVVKAIQGKAPGRTMAQAKALARALLVQQDGSADRWEVGDLVEGA
ncbi:MAG TPA: hypothetical protein VN524_10670 [Hyphomicrobiaceae bacterium]|nr:hypothetical protein [Hyphomicrobiaceae bacterium]